MQEEIHDSNQRAFQLIELAEGMFGQISSPWRFSGVTFRDHPPHLYYFPETLSVHISLSLRVLGDSAQRDFQLAHEVCHLLYPSVDPENPIPPKATVLNEGISTLFSILIVESEHGDEIAGMFIESLKNNSQKYFSAFRLVIDLIKSDAHIIKNIRAIQPMINDVSIEDLISVNAGLTKEAAKELTSIF